MANLYALQQVGVADGTLTPPNRADGGQVNAHSRVLVASKQAGTDAWNNGDVVYLGKKPKGHKIVKIELVTDTSFATSTIDVGIGTDPRTAFGTTTAGKYATGQTVTTVNKPTVIGPLASTVDDDAPDEEFLYATIGVANVAAAVVASLLVHTAAI